MPKINVYLPDRLAEALRSYEIPVSATCQQALEREVAARLPFLELTHRARDVLTEASRQANRLGQNFVGVEHLLLAILEEGGSMPSHVIAEMGLTEALRAKLHEVIAAPAASNQAVDYEGNVLGYLFEDGRVVSLEGKSLRVALDEDGHAYAVDEAGKRQPPVPMESAPILMSLDEEGRPVVVIDERGRHTGRK